MKNAHPNANPRNFLTFSTRDSLAVVIASLEADVRLKAEGIYVEGDVVNELEIAKRTLAAYEGFDRYVRATAELFKISIHGDLYRYRDGVEYDLEFPTISHATSFANVLTEVAREDLRFPNEVRDFVSPVTVTVRFGAVSPIAELRP